ncbi:MAG TPA: hypothetical protein VFC63_02675 [Blastocatellia bacterium]|nr:hypothetical protein [Blastocatellia bacterium]
MKRVNGFVASQRGAGRIKFIFIICMISVIAVILFRGLPVYITDQEIQHDLKEAARTGAIRNATEAQIRKELMKNQEEYWITLPENTQYNIVKKPNSVEIEINTTIPINFIVTTYDYQIKYKAFDQQL